MAIFDVGEAVDQLSGLMRGASRILVFTGAGVSTASGIPDYRGPQGVWNTRTPVYYDEFMSSDEQRRRYWQQRMEDRASLGEVQPNRIHHALVRLEESGKLEALVTQNVDGLHAIAGTSDERLVEVHGTARRIECQTCGDLSEPADAYAAFAETGKAPECACGGYLKPATISFGQSLRMSDFDRAIAAAGRCDLVVALGSTLSVTPAASIPLMALERGVPYAIVNRGATEHDRLRAVTLRIEGDLTEIVPPAIEAALAGSGLTGAG